MENMIEMRKSSRIPYWAAVSFNQMAQDEMTSTKGHTMQLYGTCLNLSEGGMLIESFDKVPEGSILSIEMILNGKNSESKHRFLGKVVHSQRIKKSYYQGLGINFIKRPMNFEKFLKISEQ